MANEVCSWHFVPCAPPYYEAIGLRFTNSQLRVCKACLQHALEKKYVENIDKREGGTYYSWSDYLIFVPDLTKVSLSKLIFGGAE